MKPAFPTQTYDAAAAQQGIGVTITDDPGMSLRDYFAGQALAGLLARDDSRPALEDAESAYQIADAMLVEREGGIIGTYCTVDASTDPDLAGCRATILGATASGLLTLRFEEGSGLEVHRREIRPYPPEAET